MESGARRARGDTEKRKRSTREGDGAVSDLRKRLQSLHDGLPEDGRVALTKTALAELLGLEPEVRTDTEHERDMTTDELAARYDVTKGTVLRWLHCGRLGTEGNGWYRLGRRYYIRASKVRDRARPSRQRQADLRLPRQAAG